MLRFIGCRYNIVACRDVTRQRQRDKQIYLSLHWVTRFANKTNSHGNDLSNVSTAMNQLPTVEVLLETVFSTVVLVEELQAGRNDDLAQEIPCGNGVF
jgi:hypothetical protein